MGLGADVLTSTWVISWDLHALVTQPLHLFDVSIDPGNDVLRTPTTRDG